MALPTTVGDREFQKFVETDAGDTAVRTQPSNINGVSTGNSTVTLLTGSSTYTGAWTDVSSYPGVMTSAKSDQSGTLYMEFSDTNTGSGKSILTYNCAANVPEVHRLSITNQYYRTRYTNDSTDQTSFYLTTLFGEFENLSAPRNLIVGQDADAALVRVVSEEFDISQGLRAGYTVEHIFGENTDLDSATVPEDIWNGGGVYTGFPTGSAETIEAFSSSTNDDEGGSGAEIIYVQGLDANYAVQTESITLNGTGAVATTTTWTRVHRITVTQSANGANTSFNDGTITVRHTTTTANVFVQSPVGTNFSRICAFTTPAEHNGFIHHFFAEIEGQSSAVAEGALWIREFGKPPKLVAHFTVKDNRTYNFEIYGGIMLPPKTDVAIRLTSSSANNVDVTGEMDIVVVKI